MLDVSVVIPTFRRPRLLEKTIASVAGQRNKLNLAFEIIVVDNCPEQSAKLTVGKFIESYDIPIRYVSESRQNIALARNAGIDHSDAKFVGMLDDDEQAHRDWLDNLVQTIENFSADVVVGPTRPAFEKETPDWFLGNNLFDRRRNIPTGTELTVASSANFLMRTSTCVANNNRFDPDLGRKGGSDTDFFMRLNRSMGCKIVWCREAMVEEFIPETRVRVGYLLKREFRSSQVFVRCTVRYSDKPLITAAYLTFGVGVAQIAVWLVPGLLSLPFRTQYSVRAKRMLVRGLGKLFWGKVFRFTAY